MSIPVQNIYYLLCYAWNNLEQIDKIPIAVDNNTELINLFARVLINSSINLLKRGFERNYIPVTEERVGVRGKLEVSESIKKNSFQHLKAVCSYDEYSADILHNQILASTLLQLLRTENLDDELKDRIRKLLRMFPPITIIELKAVLFRNIKIHRNNRLYGFILNVCQLIYESSLPTQDSGHWLFSDFTRDENKMAYLFENFVFRFYAVEIPELKPKRDHINWNLQTDNESHSKFLPLMKTDITLHGSDPKIIIDTKYYRETMRENYQKEKIKSENLYQLFSYLLNQEDGTEDTLKTKGILLYPTIEEEYNLHFQYKSHEIQIKTVNLNTHWTNIERRLKEIVSLA